MSQTLLLFVLTVFLWASLVDAQIKTTLTLIELEKTAQSTALGDGGSYLQGLNALGTNPAGLHTKNLELLAQYHNLPLETNLAILGIAYPLRPFQTTLAVSYLGLRSSGFDRRDEFGERKGDFIHQDQMISLHMSRPVSILDLHSISLGLSLKLLRSQVDTYDATALAFDLGSRYSFGKLPLSLSLAGLNIGKGLNFINEESKLPTSLLISAAYRLGLPATLIASISYLPHEGRQDFSLGIESWIAGVLALRGHYSLISSGISQGMGFHNVTVGFGFKFLKQNTLDYTFEPFDEQLRSVGAIGTHRVSLTFRFQMESQQ